MRVQLTKPGQRWSRRASVITRPLKIVIAVAVRAFLTALACTGLVFVVLDITIDGGFRSVVFPNGLPANPTPAAQARIDQFHLDQNVFVRFGHWVWDALRGDFGRSFPNDRPVADIVIDRLPVSLELTLVSLVVILAVGVPLGVFAATSLGPRSRRVVDVFFGISQSFPYFISPILLVWIFSLQLGWLDPSGWVRISDSLTGNLRSLIMPTIVLAFSEIGHIGRMVRADVARVLGSEFVIAAMSKGLTARYVLFRHALRPAALGAVNLVGLKISGLLAGSFVVEFIFALPGIGRAMIESMINRDLYVLVGMTTYVVGVFVVVNALVDACVALMDPRI